MKQPIEQGGDGRGVAQQLAPVVDGSIRCQERGRPLVAPHDQFEEIFGSRVRQLAHAEVIDDEQRNRREFSEVVLACTGERRVGEFFEQRVGLAIDDAIALLDGGAPDGLGEMALAGPWR
jgi:hypothetical protein